ncbi:MAG TPA: LON peptidase substrate-binding domain-containing protein [Lacipirellulaceae bacterium]|jgi:ATP-dependent Lon protease|nr:LON peptidase substrate-binding domain-containing protein [Lacipirellulaceae bacterium]
MKPFDAAELNFDASTFSGVARLFPLPNLVLYPHVMQPLHIFEDRYREMLEDALAGDQLITMSVLEPGWETDYESRPPISQHACLGKVVAHHRLDDGHYNLLLLGVQRARILQELDPIRSFRQARVELIEDCYDFQSACERGRVQEELMSAFRTQLPCACELPEQLEGMLTDQLPLGLLTDLAAYTLPLAAEVKMQLLAECRVRGRAEILLGEVKKLAGASSKKSALIFPPAFSDN